VALAAGGLTYWLLSRSGPSPEELIRQKAEQMADAAEKKDLGFIMDQVSRDFRTEDGVGRDEVKGILAGQFLRGQWVRVFTSDIEVTMTSADSADFKGSYIFGRSDAKLLKDLAKESVMGSYEITAKVVKEADGEWRFISARWRQVESSGLF
jgi:ketosteroid isomerase-like protein